MDLPWICSCFDLLPTVSGATDSQVTEVQRNIEVSKTLWPFSATDTVKNWTYQLEDKIISSQKELCRMPNDNVDKKPNHVSARIHPLL